MTPVGTYLPIYLYLYSLEVAQIHMKDSMVVIERAKTPMEIGRRAGVIS